MRQSGANAPVLCQDKIAMRLADGTASHSVRGKAYMSIARVDMPLRCVYHPVFVVDGPHCLLGRPTLEALWPEVFHDLYNVTKVSADALNISTVKYTEQPPPTTAAAAAACVLPASADAPATAAAAHTHPRAAAAACVPPATAATAATYTRTAAACPYGCALPATAPAAAAAATTTTASATGSDSDTTPPPRRPLPPQPTGVITKEIGREYCYKLCGVYPELFTDGLGKLIGGDAEIRIKPGHENSFGGVRPAAKVPYGVQDEVEAELDKLYETAIPIDPRELDVASQVVPVVKTKNGKRRVRLCINYKNTINEHLMDEPCSHPVTNEQLDKLLGEYWSCIDVKHAFRQVAVPSRKSQKILAFVTSRGYAIPTRLQYGVKTAPGIFNNRMAQIIHGMGRRSPIPSTACMMDDICTTGATPQEHFDNLAELLYRLYAAGLKLNKDKCKFYESEVKFLGKVIDKDGIRLDPDAVSAIANMPAPTDAKTLRSFLGHMSYIGRHVPDLRTARAPLDALLKADAKFFWSDKEADAFEKCKKLASNPATLALYDPKLPIVLTTDASPAGVGACLSHRVTVNGKAYLRPLSYASRSLTPAERNYAQVEREGLAVVWAIDHYRLQLLGIDFEVHTDCSALTRIFGPKNNLGGCATGRLNRWAAQLMEYNFVITHIKGASNKTCDSLSRLPVPSAGDLKAPYPTGTGSPVS